MALSVAGGGAVLVTGRARKGVQTMAKVEVLRAFFGPIPAGTVIDLPDALAKEVVSVGKARWFEKPAEKVEPPKPEAEPERKGAKK